MDREVSRNIEKIISIISFLFIAQAFLGAFSLASRTAIKERSREKYGRVTSEVSQKNDGILHAAHINHDRKNENYDKPENGVLMTIQEHYDDHVKRHGKNGLHPLGNLHALKLLWQSLSISARSSRHSPDEYTILLFEGKEDDTS